MLPIFRKGRRKLFVPFMIFATFLSVWMLMTIFLLELQEQFFQADRQQGAPNDISQSDYEYLKNRVQVVVGHYNGNLPKDEKQKKNLSEETINENNYNPFPGFGEKGKAVRLNGEDEIKSKDLFQINQFNLVASDRIALNRTLLDARKKACRGKIYPSVENLPDTSVIIVFHNEAFSTLARTVVSVINRSPAKLLKEIILVDDASERDFLQSPLEKFAMEQSAPVHIIRSKKRVGLIRARLLGAKRGKGKVLTFLDSHCECTEGWLEPLLSRISEDRTVAVCPIIDVINDQTFAYNKGIELFRGGFNWNLQFRWYSVSPKEITRRGRDSTAPIRSPTMAGGLFSIERDYFYEVGSYDNQMDIWGGENLEMSFRIWQCGGKVEILPCSHVGHVFRKASPHDFPGQSSSKVLNTNLARLAEVWMDQWKYLFYNTAPQAREIGKTTDVSERVKLRKNLKCHDFKWYLNNVWPEHFLPMEDQFFGRIKNRHINLCLVSTPGETAKRKHSLSMQRCSLGFDFWQLWIYTKDNFLRGDEHQCLTATEISKTWIVQLKECTETDKDKWDYNTYKRHLVHKLSGLCLTKPLTKGSADEVHSPSLAKCNRDDSKLEWIMSPVKWLPSD